MLPILAVFRAQDLLRLLKWVAVAFDEINESWL